MKYPELANPEKQTCGSQGLEGKGIRKWLFNGEEVSVWDDEKILQPDSTDHCTTL